MKKLLSVLLVALLLVSVAPMTGVSDMLGVTASAEDLSGTEEENIISGTLGTMKWSFNELTGILYIDCNGNMPSMGSESEQPWKGFRSKIRDIAFSETVTSISGFAFCGCSNLTSITIPEGVTSIGNSAFYGCRNLTSITIPESVTSIGDYAFYYCSNLENVVISNGVEIINSFAFAGCSKIKGIIIPSSVTLIRPRALSECTSLEKVYIYNKSCTIYSASIPASAVIYGFAGSTAETYAKNNGTIFTAMDDTHEHSYTATVVAPTCTKDGYTQYSCICGESYKDNFTNATGHSFGDYVVTTKPTCQSSGTETKTCSVCGATSSRTIAKLEHNFGTWVVTKEATCIATGTETSTCRECGTTTTRTIAKTEHTFGSWVTVNEATCTQNGLEKSVCSYCKNEITRETEKASHSYVVSSVKDATCTETGYTTHTCKNCGDSYIDSIKEIIDHTDKNNDGVCDNCKAVLGTYCNHDYVITYTAPTCTNAGSIKLVCSLCKKESVTTIDSLDHNYVAFTFEPTCTQDGYTKHYCINCGDEYIDAKVKAPGHQMRVEKIVPTCTQNGCDIVICSDCGYNYETKVVKALGHDDFNRDGKCDICNENLGTPENPSDNCSHICHKAQSGGFYKVIYKILVVFWKLFGTNKTCSCGVKHY